VHLAEESLKSVIVEMFNHFKNQDRIELPACVMKVSGLKRT
jgi:hypothetical protein